MILYYFVISSSFLLLPSIAGIQLHPINKQIRLQFFYKWKSDTKDDEREVYELRDSEKMRIDSLESNNYEYMDGHEWGTHINYSSRIGLLILISL